MDTPTQTLDANEIKVLQELRSSSLPGYALQSKTGLGVPELIDAANKLRDRMLLRVTGELNASAISDSIFSVPIDVIGEVDVLLGNLRPGRSERFLRR